MAVGRRAASFGKKFQVFQATSGESTAEIFWYQSPIPLGMFLSVRLFGRLPVYLKGLVNDLLKFPNWL